MIFLFDVTCFQYFIKHTYTDFLYRHDIKYFFCLSAPPPLISKHVWYQLLFLKSSSSCPTLLLLLHLRLSLCHCVWPGILQLLPNCTPCLQSHPFQFILKGIARMMCHGTEVISSPYSSKSSKSLHLLWLQSVNFS